MNCDNYRPLIDSLFDDELEEDASTEIIQHLEQCSVCTAYVANVERETQMYAHYLFDVEPPRDLPARFSERLAAEDAVISGRTSSFVEAALSFLNTYRLQFAGVTVAVLILTLVAVGLLRGPESGLKLVASDVPVSFNAEEIKVNPTPEALSVISKRERTVSPVVAKVSASTRGVNQRKPTSISPKRQSESPKPPRPNEPQKEMMLVAELETDAARQLERVELLLRSFRNARLIDGSEIFDVTFEARQARRLLQENMMLRQKAEYLGADFTGIMLNRVEPYLLEIANLRIDSTPEEVIGIKERVRNQNIIASLQAF